MRTTHIIRRGVGQLEEETVRYLGTSAMIGPEPFYTIDPAVMIQPWGPIVPYPYLTEGNFPPDYIDPATGDPVFVATATGYTTGRANATDPTQYDSSVIQTMVGSGAALPCLTGPGPLAPGQTRCPAIPDYAAEAGAYFGSAVNVTQSSTQIIKGIPNGLLLAIAGIALFAMSRK